ncbi:hypothetical protein NPIL_643411 [Nephila pilipes]|uniref:DM2 domain-containing protein n=1 Tax=Nephila pilipes TaxID=299642 RepID=A0A8X6JHF2_NEPPI|nr:hypothetical protein NPIL_643411 [Nephila pilipes]
MNCSGNVNTYASVTKKPYRGRHALFPRSAGTFRNGPPPGLSAAGLVSAAGKRACRSGSKYVPEHRLSKRKKLKPTKKIIASRAEVPKFDTGAICVPVIKMHTETTSAPANREDSVTETGTEVMVLPLKMESASVPEKPRKPRKNSTPKKRGPQNIKRKMTRQELEDYKLAKTLQAADFNLRERISKRIIQQTISPKIEPVEMSATSTERRKSRKYGLSPELANIIGRKEMRPDKIAEKMYMILKKRNLLSGNGRSVNCDMDLSKKLFSGKRHFPVSDIMGLLRKHMIYVV